MEIPKYKQIVMLVLDGFGVASNSDGNAVVAAEPANLDYLVNHYPATTLQASGPAVGLPWGERGNSEVGHLNLGAGRIVNQDLPRIDLEISTHQFFENPAFLAASEHVKKNNSRLHLAGMVSSGGVHSFDEHLFALLAFAADQGLKEVYIHMFTDGRDTHPKIALSELDKLEKKIKEIGVGKIATVSGRFYAMDRAKHWELTERTFAAMVQGKGETCASANEAIQRNYDKQIFDETIPPTVITTDGKPTALVASNDAIIFFNFRADRMSQLAKAFAQPDLKFFSGQYEPLQNLLCVTMTVYEDDLRVLVAFPPLLLVNGTSEVISKNKLTQVHIAESEKYAHVTYFFDGAMHDPWEGEEREIVSSPESYEKRYQDVPEMSANKVAESVIASIKKGINFILANFANPDMVGHTGNRQASIQAVKAVDKYIGEISRAALEAGACFIVTADHGNIEQLIDVRTGAIEKQHSMNPVPFLVVAKELEFKFPRERGYLELPAIVPEGVLSDAAPTVLELMGLPKPPEMTAISLMNLLLEQIDSRRIKS